MGKSVKLLKGIFSSFMVVNISNSIIKEKICPSYPYPLFSLFSLLIYIKRG